MAQMKISENPHPAPPPPPPRLGIGYAISTNILYGLTYCLLAGGKIDDVDGVTFFQANQPTQDDSQLMSFWNRGNEKQEETKNTAFSVISVSHTFLIYNNQNRNALFGKTLNKLSIANKMFIGLTI